MDTRKYSRTRIHNIEARNDARTEAEKILRELAYALHLTRRIREEIIADHDKMAVAEPLGV